MRRVAVVAVLMIFAALACTRGDLAAVAGRVTPIGTPFETLTPRPAPTRATALPSPTPGPAPTLAALVPGEFIQYRVQFGDTLEVLAERFRIPIAEIARINGINTDTELEPDTVLVLPAREAETGPAGQLIPDSELVYGPTTVGFDIERFLQMQGGYLARHQEFAYGRVRSGAEIIEILSILHSVNPRILIALIEHQAGWVTNPDEPPDFVFPLGKFDVGYQGLFAQLDYVADALNLGYYGWRSGTFTTLSFPNDEQLRLSPGLNAGTVAVQYVFSTLFNVTQWQETIDDEGFQATYARLFGDPFVRAEVILPANLVQPDWQLPFEPGREWAYTGGPHAGWLPGSPMAAIDFAPPAIETGCVVSQEWVVAPDDGLVVYSDRGIVMLDTDGDGHMQTGWTIFFLHVATENRVPVGSVVNRGSRIGHPSCEGGRSTGTHVHIARRYNGEWMPADGPVPMVLSGWTVHNGSAPYLGTMTNGLGGEIIACQCGWEAAGIMLPP